MSYAMVLKKAQCESVETTIRKRYLLFAGAARATDEHKWLTDRMMFGTMAGGDSPGLPRKSFSFGIPMGSPWATIDVT